MNSFRRRRGFALVELLAVVSIVGVLTALILPAVQQTRAAARRVDCRNRLKQIGVAVQNYMTAQQTFPPGGITMGLWRTGTPSLSTWTIAILPHLDQRSLYGRYDLAAFNEGPENAFVREQRVGGFECPADPYTGRLARPASGPGRNLLYATGSYRAVSGKSDGSAWPGGANYFDATNTLPREWRGAMHHVGTAGLRTERENDVRDGFSNTLLAGEYSSPPCPTGGDDDGTCRRATFWAYTYTSYNQSSVCSECGNRTIMPDYDECVRRGLATPEGENACKRAWGSFHAGGFHAVLCDGSVRFVSENVNLELLAHLATIAGGEVTPAWD